MPDENVESALDDLQELYGLLRTYPEFKQDRRLRGAFAALVKSGHLKDESTRPAPAAIPSAEKAPKPYFPQTTLDPRVPVTMPNLLGSQPPISTLPTKASTDLTPRGKPKQRLRGPVTPQSIEAKGLPPYRTRPLPAHLPNDVRPLTREDIVVQSRQQNDFVRRAKAGKLTPDEKFHDALTTANPLTLGLADAFVNQNPAINLGIAALAHTDPVAARDVLSPMNQIGEQSGPLGAIISGVAESVVPGAIGLKAYSLGARAAAAAALKSVARSALRPGVQGAIGMGAGVVGGLGAATGAGHIAQKAITQSEKFIYGDVYPQVQALRAQRQIAHKGAYQLGVAGSALLYASPSAADIRIMGKLVPDMIRRLRTNAAQRAIEAKASGIRGVLSLDAPTPREVRESFSALRQTAGWSTIGAIQRERLMEGMIEIVGEGGRVLETGQPFDVSDALLNFFFGYIAPGENALGKAVLHTGPKANIGKVLEGRKTQSVDARARAAERAWEEVVAAYNPPVRRPVVAPAAPATSTVGTSTAAVDANTLPAEPTISPVATATATPAAVPAASPESATVPEPAAIPESAGTAESPSVRLSPIAAWAESLRQVQESTLSPADRVTSLANSAAQAHIQMLSMGMDPAQIDETMQRIFTSVVTNGIRGKDRKSPSKAFMDVYQQAVDTFKQSGATQGDSWLQMTPEEEAEAEAEADGPEPRPLPEEDEQNRDLITGKLFWDLTSDEMLAAHEFAKKQDVEIPKSILGDKYKRWAYLWRRINAEYNRPTTEEEKKYDDEIKEIESQLSEEDRDRLYNYGGLSQDITKYLVGELRLLETSESPLEMGQILARLMEEDHYPKDGKLDLSRPGHQYLLTYFNNANRVAQKKGWDITDVFRKAIIRLAQRRGEYAEELMGDLLLSMGVTPEEIRDQPIDPFQLESTNIDSEVDYGQHNKPESMQIPAAQVQEDSLEEQGDVTDAVSEQGADAGVLRQGGPEMGLPQVVEGNAEQGEPAGAQNPQGGNLPTTGETTGKNVNTSAFGPDKKDRRYYYGVFQGRKYATDTKLLLFDDALHDSMREYGPPDRTLEFRNEEGKATFFKGLEGKKEVLSPSTTDGENVLLVDKDGNRFYINKRYVDTTLRNGFYIAKMVKGTSPNFAVVDSKGKLQGAVTDHIFKGEIPSFELGEDASSQKKRVVVPYKAHGTRTSKKTNTAATRTEGQASAIPAAPVPDIDEQDRETLPSVDSVLERAMDDPDLRATAAGVGNSRIEIDPITDDKPYMDLRSALAHFARKTGIFVKRSDPKHPFSRAYGGLYSPKFSRAIFTKLGGVDAVAHEIAHVIHDAYRVAADLVNAPLVMKGSITRAMAAELYPFSQGALASKQRMTPAILTFADDGSFVDSPAQILAGSRLDTREANARTMNTPQGQRELTGPWTIEMEPKVGQGGYRYFVVTKESGDREEVADFDEAKERIAELRNGVDDLDILYQRSEGFAEWVRAWMINPDAAIAAAPNVYDNFKVSVPLNVIEALRELGDNIRRGQGAAEAGGKPLVQKALTQIVGLPKQYQFMNHLRALIYAHRMEREWRTSFMDRIVNRYWRDRFDPANTLLRRVMAATRQAPLETLAGMSFEDWKDLPAGTTIIDPPKDPIQQLADLNYVENKFKAIAEHGMINEAGEVVPGTEGGFLAGLAKLQSLAPKTMQELHDHFAHAMLYGLARRTLNVSAIAKNRAAEDIAKVHAEIDSRVRRIFAKLDKDEERARRAYQEKMRHAVIGVVEADRMSREREIINRALNALDPQTGDPAKILTDAFTSGKITQQQFWSWSKNPINYVKNALVGDEIKVLRKAYVALRAEAIERVRQIMDPAMARNPIHATGLDVSVRDIVENAILREETRAKNGLQVLRQKFDRQRTRLLKVAAKAKQQRTDPIQQRLTERLHYMMGFAEGTDFTDEEIAQKILDELNKDPDVAKAYEDLHDWMIHWSNSVLHYAFERGRITEEQYSRLLTDNYWYMPIRREMSGQGMGEEVYYDEAVQSMLDSAAGLTQGKDFSRNNRHADTLIVRPVIKEFKGDTRQILNPFTTLIENTHAIVKEADRNAIFASIDRLVRGGRKAMYSQLDPHPQFGIWITAVPSQHEATKGIEYFVEGKKHYIHFEDKYVEEALRGAGKLHFPSAVESAFRFITHIQRANIVSSLRYLLTNKIRDVPESAIKSPFAGKSGAHAKTSQGAQRGTPGKQVRDLSKYWTVRTTPQMDRLYELYGGGTSALEDLAMGSRMRAGQSPYARSLDAFLDKTYQGERTLLHKVRRGIKFIFVTAPMHVREKAEESTRAQEYRLAKEFADAYGYSEHEANTFAMRQARMLLDHQRGGLATKEIGKYVVFFNAHFQGVASTVDRVNALWGRGDKIQAAKMLRRLLWRAIFLSGTMEILTRLWTRHVWGEEETKEHASFPPWARDNFYLIKAGHDLWLSVAKPHELSLPASFFLRLYEAIRTGDWQDAFYGFPETVIKNLLPGRGYGTLAGSAEPLMSLYYNMDSETGKTIVDPWEMGADLSLRTGQNKASNLARWASSLYNRAPGLPDVDPRQADYMLNSYFGDTYRMTSGALNINRDDEQKTTMAQMMQRMTGLMREGPGEASQQGMQAQELIKKGSMESRHILMDPYQKLSNVRRKAAESEPWWRWGNKDLAEAKREFRQHAGERVPAMKRFEDQMERGAQMFANLKKMNIADARREFRADPSIAPHLINFGRAASAQQIQRATVAIRTALDRKAKELPPVKKSNYGPANLGILLGKDLPPRRMPR